ncbi:MAG: nucleoside-diphosphate kinase, partial [Thermoproteota archaeon]|nr:nucleoside-diphosphate kinase [Thermoproteota archaeon]
MDCTPRNSSGGSSTLAIEQTLIVIKPDGFRRHLTGKILARFEEKGFQLRNLKSYDFTKEKAQEFYSV